MGSAFHNARDYFFLFIYFAQVQFITLNFVRTLQCSLVLYYYAGAGLAGSVVKTKRRSAPSYRGCHQRIPDKRRRRLKIRRWSWLCDGFFSGANYIIEVLFGDAKTETTHTQRRVNERAPQGISCLPVADLHVLDPGSVPAPSAGIATTPKLWQLRQLKSTILKSIVSRIPYLACVPTARRPEYWAQFTIRVKSMTTYNGLAALLLELRRAAVDDAFHAAWLASRGALWAAETAAARKADAVWRVVTELGDLNALGENENGTGDRGFDWVGSVERLWEAERAAKRPAKVEARTPPPLQASASPAEPADVRSKSRAVSWGDLWGKPRRVCGQEFTESAHHVLDHLRRQIASRALAEAVQPRPAGAAPSRRPPPRIRYPVSGGIVCEKCGTFASSSPDVLAAHAQRRASLTQSRLL